MQEEDDVGLLLQGPRGAKWRGQNRRGQQEQSARGGRTHRPRRPTKIRQVAVPGQLSFIHPPLKTLSTWTIMTLLLTQTTFFTVRLGVQQMPADI